MGGSFSRGFPSPPAPSVSVPNTYLHWKRPGKWQYNIEEENRKAVHHFYFYVRSHKFTLNQSFQPLFGILINRISSVTLEEFVKAVTSWYPFSLCDDMILSPLTEHMNTEMFSTTGYTCTTTISLSMSMKTSQTAKLASNILLLLPYQESQNHLLKTWMMKITIRITFPYNHHYHRYDLIVSYESHVTRGC